MSIFEGMSLSAQLEKIDEWRKWCEEIPYINFPQDWSVKIIPPLTGAIVRFRVNTPKASGISVYLDCYDRLGFFGEPYWEVYPYKNDIFRCKMNDIESLLKAISEVIT